jgi:fatty-acyl-CoA synthase
MVTFDWIAKQADLRGDKAALVRASDGRSTTYAEFHEHASAIAEFLRDEWRIQPGDRVALLAGNSPEYFEILWGCARVGAILVCLNWRLAVPELEKIVRDSTPSALLFDAEYAAPARALASSTGMDRLMILGGPAAEGEALYEQTLAQASGRPIVMPARSLNDPWHLLYTAGTTGRAKGVLQTFGMVLYNAINMGLKIDLTSEDVTLNLLPCFHTGGLNLYANPTLHVGGTAIIQRAFEPAETLRLLSTQTTAFFGVAAIYLFLSQHADFESTDLLHVRSWAAGGAPIPTSLLQLYRRRGIDIRFGFGMTETGPTVFLVDPGYPESKLGSVGKPCLHIDVRIVDSHGRDLPAGERGELLVTGPSVTPGYWQLPEVTAQSFTNGWLHTGDVALRDADGYYYIVDRLKDMYISGGENVYPAEVENVIYQLAQVGEAAVIGVADEKWGEVGCAVVVVKPGMQIGEAEIIEHCQAHLARYKAPRSVRFVSALPRNPAGKVDKAQLRKEHGA